MAICLMTVFGIIIENITQPSTPSLYLTFQLGSQYMSPWVCAIINVQLHCFLVVGDKTDLELVVSNLCRNLIVRPDSPYKTS